MKDRSSSSNPQDILIDKETRPDKIDYSQSKFSSIGPRDLELLNPDAYGRLIGRHNDAPITINGVRTKGLLDTGAVTSSISIQFCKDHDIEILPLRRKIPPLELADGTCYHYLGQCALQLQIPELDNLDLVIPALVVPHTEYHGIVPMIVGTNILDEIFKIIKIPCLETIFNQQLADDLPDNWQYTFKSLLTSKVLQSNLLKSLGKTKLSKKTTIPALGYKICSCTTKARIQPGYTASVITEPTKASKLPACIDSKNPLVELSSGSTRTRVILINRSSAPVHLAKGTVVGETFLANKVPKLLPQSTHLPESVEGIVGSTQVQKDWILDRVDLSGTDTWTPSLRKKASNLLVEYSDIFSQHEYDLGKTNLIKHEIKLEDNEDQTPIKGTYKRIPPHLIDDVRKHLEEMEEIGMIRKSFSPWSNSIVLVKKADGTLGYCIDLRKINTKTVKEAVKPSQHLEKLSGAKWFTTLGVKAGVWQVELTETSKPLTAFTVGPLGFFECERVPYGAVNTPATLQKLMESCLGDMNLNWCILYLDKLIVFEKDPEGILTQLQAVFQKLREAGLKIPPEECTFFQKQIKFQEYLISEDGIAIDPEKVRIIQQWPKPKTLFDLKQFMHFVGCFRRFIHKYSAVAKPLTDILEELGTHTSGKQIELNLSDTEQLSYEQLKEALKSPPVLGFADYKKPFILHTDSSGTGLGAVLYQRDHKQKLRVISYASRSLTQAEQLFPAHKLEFLALKWAITSKFKDYLYGTQQPFEVYTDNNPLTYVLISAKLDATTQRWIADLASYNFSIHYKSGKHNVEADILSRLDHEQIEEEQKEEMEEDPLDLPIEWKDVLHNKEICYQISPGVVNSLNTQMTLTPELIHCMAVHPKAVPSRLLAAELATNEHPVDWIKLQAEDPVLKFLQQQLQGKKRLRSYGELKAKAPKGILDALSKHQHTYFQYKLREGVLFREIKTPHTKSKKLYQLMVPQALVPDVLQGCHDQIGHMGRDRTLQMIRERFFFPQMRKIVSFHISNCTNCKSRKAVSPKEPLKPIVTLRPMQLVHMDFLSLEPSKDVGRNPSKKVLIVTDHFTGYAQAYPSAEESAVTTARLLDQNFFQHYGYPERIVSDQGRNFDSDLVKELCKLKGIKKIRTTPYHPMTDGKAERFNSTLMNMLGTMEEDEKEHWKDHVARLTYAYNCTRNTKTGYSPYYLIFGKHPRLPIDIKFGLYKQADSMSFSRTKYLKRVQSRLKQAQAKAQKLSALGRVRNKKYYDPNTKPLELEIGDLVLVKITVSEKDEAKTTDKDTRKKRKKLANRWESSEYVVIEKPIPNIPVYKVEPLTGTHKKVKTKTLHRNLLLPLGVNYSCKEETVEPIEQEIEDEPLIVTLEKSSQHEVNKQKHRISPPEDEESIVITETEKIAPQGLTEMDILNPEYFVEETQEISSDSDQCSDTTDDESSSEVSVIEETVNTQSSGTESISGQDSELKSTEQSSAVKDNSVQNDDIEVTMDDSTDTKESDQVIVIDDDSSTDSSRLPQMVEDIRLPEVVDSTESDISSLDPDSEWILGQKDDSQQTEAIDKNDTQVDTPDTETDKSDTEVETQEKSALIESVEEEIPRRTSKRSNFGAPPNWYGNVITHSIRSIVSPKLTDTQEAVELYAFQY